MKSDDPELYKEMKRKAGRISLEKRERYKINSIELVIKNKLIEAGLNFEYSVILGSNQFDFGEKENRILLEVQGDYWHGNPEIYKELNSIQLSNRQRDIIKKEFAENHNFKIFYIWEKEIKENNFSVIEDIKNEIRTNRN